MSWWKYELCETCPLNNQKPVTASGPRNADIMLVGEGPGRDEAIEGRPFVGRSGRLLNAMLKNAKVDRAELYITNAELCFPKVDPARHAEYGDDFETVLNKIKHLAMNSCQPRLFDEIELVKPKVIVALGGIAMKSIAGVSEGILKMRGGVTRITVRGHECWFVPTLHPAYLLRGQEHLAPVVTMDLIQAKALNEGGGYRDETLLICEPGAHDTIKEAKKYLNEWLERGATVAIDVETTGFSPIEDKLRTIALAAIDDKVCVVFPVNYELSKEDTQEFLALTKSICASLTVATVYQNLGFDCTALEMAGMPVKGTVHDTLVMHHVGEPEWPHGLDWQAHTYLTVTPWKAEERRRTKRGEDTLYSLMEYNAKDALYTAWLVPPLREAIEESHGELAVEKEVEWAQLARQMTITGVPINQVTLDKFEADLEGERDKLLKEMQDEMDWPEMNLNRPVHRQEFLYERLKLPVRKYTEKTQQPSTSYKAVVDFLHTEPLVAKYVDYVDKSHQLSTFIRGYKKRISSDGRLRVSWNPTGTVGSRWSSTPNLQNVPKDLRAMVEPKAGRLLVGADYAALEFRILACFSGCTSLLDAIKDGVDIHSLNASRILKESWDRLDDKGKKTMRTLIKRVVYGLNYGAEAQKLTSVLREDRKAPVEMRRLITLPRVQGIRKGFFELYPEIKEYQDAQVEFADTNGYLEVPPLGRRRYFGAIPVSPTKAYNFRIQTAAGDIMNLAMLKLDKMLPKSADILINGHDAVYVECDEEDAEAIGKMIEEAMFYHLVHGDFEVDLVAAAEIGRTWKDV